MDSRSGGMKIIRRRVHKEANKKKLIGMRLATWNGEVDSKDEVMYDENIDQSFSKKGGLVLEQSDR